jgi:anti-sigma factor RsiW
MKFKDFLKEEKVDLDETIDNLIQKSSSEELKSHLAKHPRMHWTHQIKIRNAIIAKKEKEPKDPNSIWNKKVGA